MRQKIDYIHQNPVKRGYDDLPEHWRYSSARDYAGMDGLLDVIKAVASLAGIGGKDGHRQAYMDVFKASCASNSRSLIPLEFSFSGMMKPST